MEPLEKLVGKRLEEEEVNTVVDRDESVGNQAVPNRVFYYP